MYVAPRQPALFVMEEAVQAPEQLGRASVREIYAKQILTKGNGSMSGYDYSLNPYVGCGFGCSYCFASFFQAEQERFDAWGTWIEIKVNAESLLKKKRDLKGAKIFMSSATDPYQPLEAKVELTRRIVELMSEPARQPRLVVQTRGPLVARDIDILRRYENVRVNMSITTDSDDIRKQFEPGCASIEKRMVAIRKVKEAGIRTSVVICPMLPIENPERFAGRLRSLNADYYATGFFISAEKKQFASNTRDRAWELAKSFGWNKERYAETVAHISRCLPGLNRPGGWAPV